MSIRRNWRWNKAKEHYEVWHERGKMYIDTTDPYYMKTAVTVILEALDKAIECDSYGGGDTKPNPHHDAEYEREIILENQGFDWD